MNKPLKITSGIVGGAVLLGIGVGIGSGGNQTTVTRTVAGPTVTRTVKVPGEVKTVIRNVPGPTKTVYKTRYVPASQGPSGTTIARWSGSGSAVTGSVSAPSSGSYIVSWTYWGNSDPSMGGATNFAIAANDQNASALSLPNDIQSSGHGSTEVTGAQGSESFNVQAAQGASWTITVKSA